MASDPISDPAARLLGRAAQVIAGVILVLVVVGGVLFTTLRTNNSLMFTVDVLAAPDHRPAIGGDPDATSFFRTVTIVDEHSSGWVRLLAWVPNALYGALIAAGCVFVLTQTGRMLRGRVFTRATVAGLAGVGALAIVVAFVAPMVDAQTTIIALRDLGIATAEPGVYDSTEPGVDLLRPDRVASLGQIMSETQWLVVGIGGILLLLSVACARGLRLQRDTEGLV